MSSLVCCRAFATDLPPTPTPDNSALSKTEEDDEPMDAGGKDEVGQHVGCGLSMYSACPRLSSSNKRDATGEARTMRLLH